MCRFGAQVPESHVLKGLGGTDMPDGKPGFSIGLPASLWPAQCCRASMDARSGRSR